MASFFPDDGTTNAYTGEWTVTSDGWYIGQSPHWTTSDSSYANTPEPDSQPEPVIEPDHTPPGFDNTSEPLKRSEPIQRYSPEGKRSWGIRSPTWLN